MDASVFGVKYLETAAVVGFFLALLALERALPLRRPKRPWINRAWINFLLSAAAFVVGVYLVRPLSLGIAGWTQRQSFGLLQVFPLPSGVEFAAGFLLLDLTFYYWHRANHAVSLLWRFHNVHHADPDLDVTTSFRFHFVEVLYSTGFRVFQVGLIGVAPAVYVVYELCFQCATVFHHSNLRIPLWAERLLNRIIVTPRMHGIHHSDIEGETNSNYSVIFRWWDALHRSLRLNVTQSIIDIGVAGYTDRGDNELWSLVAMPFRKQRDYWRFGDGSPAARDSEAYQGNHGVLAE